MNISFEKLTNRRGILTISILMVCVTFPAFILVYANGIDPPLSWVFNFLIRGKLFLGKDIIFPHGPLAFVMYPLPVGSNVFLTLGLHILIRITFAFGIICLRPITNKQNYLESVVYAFILLAVLDILLIMIGLVLLGYMKYLQSRQSAWLFVSFALTAFAIYVKAFVGIVCGLATLAFFCILFIEVIRKESSRLHLLFSLIPVLLLISVWLIMYGSLNGLPRYFVGMIQLAGDNSAAVSYYPYNNWIYIGLSFLLLSLLIVLHFRMKEPFKLFLLVLPCFFAVWKYGMAREDYLHEGMYFLFLVLFILLFNLTISKFRMITILAGAAIIILSYQNLRNSFYFEPPVFSVSGLKNLSDYFFRYSYIADTCQQASFRNCQRNRLDNDIRTMIGNSTVDVFPWDYSFIPANNLNWVPRPVLQSYASYTPWLDRENALHYNSSKAPEFLIWELRKITHDIHNGTMESIDGRYLLNDQPEAILSMLSNYKLVRKQEGTFPLMIFKKRRNPLSIQKKFIGQVSGNWNNWIKVPEIQDGILRASSEIRRNFPGNVKSFVYKDEACFIYYELANGEIRMYRIVPKNAAEGLWINPLILNPEKNRIEQPVKRVMFKCTNPALMKGEIRVRWEQLSFPDVYRSGAVSNAQFQTTDLMFGETIDDSHNIILNSTNNLESDFTSWSQNHNPVKSGKAHSGSTCCFVGAESYSLSFQMDLDSIAGLFPDSNFLIRASAWVKAQERLDAFLVISIEREEKSIEWKAVELDKFNLEKGEWNYACNFLPLTPEMISKPGTKLKMYLWNKGKTTLLTDDLNVIIERSVIR
ncbi:MAG: hypothetical protein HXX13_06345 [Bacteroidetes bacterium]|nr:hypothetical protein [Bacteroidota bacterium]